MRVKRRIRNVNHHGFIFKKEEHTKRYEYLSHRRIKPTRYADDETLNPLGLRSDVDTLVNNLGLNYLLHYEFMVYANLTLNISCTLEVKLFKVQDESLIGGTELKITDTISFHMRDSDLVETLGDILHLPNNGEGDIPKLVRPQEL